MTKKQWLAVAALASLSLTATAQQVPQQPDPLDANAAVPASTYESVFKNYQPIAADEQASPEKAWRTANDDMGKLGGHAGHMKDTVSATSVSPASPTQASDHRKHH